MTNSFFKTLSITVLTVSMMVGNIPHMASSAQATPRNASYVSVGDSMTANTPISRAIDGRIREKCLNGPGNYPRVAAKSARVSHGDYSCNGSDFNTATRRLAQAIREGKLGHGTKTVTIMLGYVENWGTIESSTYGLYLFYCLFTGCTNLERSAPLLNVRNYERKIRYALDIIRGYAPNAQVIFLSYPTLTTPDGQLCTPQTGSVPWTRAFGVYEKKMTDTIRTVAARNNAKFLDVYSKSQRHSPCDSRPWLDGFSTNGSSTPLHPNTRGNHAIGTMLAPLLTKR